MTDQPPSKSAEYSRRWREGLVFLRVVGMRLAGKSLLQIETALLKN